MAKKIDEILIQSIGDDMVESLGGAKQHVAHKPHITTGSTTLERMRATRELKRPARNFPIEMIVRDDDQPRKDFSDEAHQNMVESIKRVGLIVPIGVRWSEERRLWIIAYGECRWRAMVELGEKFIPALELDDDQETIQIKQIIENCVRTDLNHMERCHAILRLMKEKDRDQKYASARLGFSEGYVSKTLSLIKLSEENKQKLIAGKLSFHRACELVRDSPTSTRKKRISKFQGTVECDLMDISYTIVINRPGDAPEDLIYALNKLLVHAQGLRDSPEQEQS